MSLSSAAGTTTVPTEKYPHGTLHYTTKAIATHGRHSNYYCDVSSREPVDLYDVEMETKRRTIHPAQRVVLAEGTDAELTRNTGTKSTTDFKTSIALRLYRGSRLPPGERGEPFGVDSGLSFWILAPGSRVRSAVRRAVIHCSIMSARLLSAESTDTAYSVHDTARRRQEHDLCD